MDSSMGGGRPVAGTTFWRAALLVLAGAVLYVAYQAECPATPPGSPADVPRGLWYLAGSAAFVVVLVLFSIRPVVSGLRRIGLWRALLLVGLGCLAVSGVAAWRRTAGAPDVVAVVILGMGLLLLALWRPTGARTLAALLAAGVALRLVLVAHVPLDAQRADMLPLIQAACRNLLSGQPPYRLYTFHEWPLPLTYLPGTWLAYLPAVAWNLDLRLVNVVASAGAVAILWAAVRRAPSAPLVGVLFLLPQVVVFDLYAEVAVFWVVLAGFLACLVRERYALAAACYGLALATSPLALIFVPLLFAFLLWRLPARQLVGTMLLAVGVATVLVLPFLLWSPSEFLYGTVTWFNDPNIAGAGGWLDRNQLYQVGLAGWFWLFDWVDWLRPIQVGLLSLATVGVLVRARTSEGHCARAGLLLAMLWAYVGFVFFNLIIWPYLYVPALLLAFLFVAESEFTANSCGGNKTASPARASP